MGEQSQPDPNLHRHQPDQAPLASVRGGEAIAHLEHDPVLGGEHPLGTERIVHGCQRRGCLGGRDLLRGQVSGEQVAANIGRGRIARLADAVFVGIGQFRERDGFQRGGGSRSRRT